MYATWLIAKSVLLEAIRRKDVYAIVLLSTLLIGALMTVDFFGLQGLVKFYREVSLTVMGAASALTVIILAGRQLPREFETRTIYPMLAKPISRFSFLAGKLLGVMLAGAFCFAIFMTIYTLGSLYLGGDFPIAIFVQHIYAQLLMLLVVATFTFLLSMLMNMDAAITLGVLFYFTSAFITNAFVYIYDYTDPVGQMLIVFLNYALPQLTLFDLSDKAVHAVQWDPVEWWAMGALTIYGLFFAAIYFGLSLILFRRRPL